jgi:hypothetical protein
MAQGFAIHFDQRDIDRLQKRMENMAKHIAHIKRIDIGQELSDWQTHDLHRHRPFTMRSRAKGQASTKIRPHSLFEMQQSVRAQRKVKRIVAALEAGKRVRKTRLHYLRWQQHYSTRPILREQIYNLLPPRMANMLRDHLKWSKTLNPVSELISQLRVTGFIR